jgi:hypothetical protein
VKASVDQQVKSWSASFKKTTPPKKSDAELENELKMLKALRESKKPMSDYKRTMMNPHVAKMSDDVLAKEEMARKFFQDTRAQREFMKESGLTNEQLYDESKIEMAQVHKIWQEGDPMIDDEDVFEHGTQTRNFHKWYMRQFKSGRIMFPFKYKHEHFYHGDGEAWVMWDEMQRLLKGGELGAQILMLWEL